MKCSTSLLPKAAEDSVSVIGIIARMVLGPLIVRGLFRLNINKEYNMIIIKYPYLTKKRFEDFLNRRGKEFTNLFWAAKGGTMDTDGCFDRTGTTARCRLGLKDREPVEKFSRDFETSLIYNEWETKVPKRNCPSDERIYTATVYEGGVRSFKAQWVARNTYPYLLKEEKKDYAAKLLGYRPESKPLEEWTPEEIKHYYGTASEGDGGFHIKTRKGVITHLESTLYSSDRTYLVAVQNLIGMVGLKTKIFEMGKYMTLKGPAQEHMVYFYSPSSGEKEYFPHINFVQSLLDEDVMTLERKKCRIQAFVNSLA